MARSRGNFFSAAHLVAQQVAGHPFHHHVDAAVVIVFENLHHARMVELLADLLLALEAIEENRIAFHFRMRDLDGDGAAVARIGRLIDGGHAAAGDQAFNFVVIEGIAGMEGSHRLWFR